ncbi:MAG: crosslink repair DNA glycosylase YcaQ family protein, partial [Dokdonella sp.]
GIFRPNIVVDGQIAGTWKRELGKAAITISANPFAAWTPALRDDIAAAATRYAAFHQQTVVVAPIEVAQTLR